MKKFFYFLLRPFESHSKLVDSNKVLYLVVAHPYVEDASIVCSVCNNLKKAEHFRDLVLKVHNEYRDAEIEVYTLNCLYV